MKIDNPKILKNLENEKLLRLSLNIRLFELLLTKVQFIKVCFDFYFLQLLIFLGKKLVGKK